MTGKKRQMFENLDAGRDPIVVSNAEVVGYKTLDGCRLEVIFKEGDSFEVSTVHKCDLPAMVKNGVHVVRYLNCDIGSPRLYIKICKGVTV